MQTPDPTLDAAYRATAYRVALDGEPIELRVDQPSPALDAWLAANGFANWVWLTAVNPGSYHQADLDNFEAMRELSQRLATQGLAFFSGVAVADRGDWPDEESYFIAGLEAQKAAHLARAYGQNAFLCGERGQPVHLCWVVAEKS